MKIRWLGPGVYKSVGADAKLHVLFPGDIAEVDDARAQALIAVGSATPSTLERVDLGYDADHPKPTKRERSDADAFHQAVHERTQNITREARLRPHFLYIHISPVPAATVKE